MTGESTSPTLGQSNGALSVQSARAEWRDYLAFLKRPVLPQQPPLPRNAVAGTARMLGLDLLIMTVFITVLLTIVGLGFDLPENLNSTLELNATTIVLVVIVAPVLEELVFRSWLSGKPGYLVAIGLLIVSGVAAAAFGVSLTGESAQAGIALSMLVGFLLATIAVVVLRNRPALGWFRTIFPGLFWLSTLAFALVHLLNYTEGALAILLPLVLPQFVLGSMAAYVRVQYGLVWAILLHAAHNGFAIGVAAIAMTMENGAA